MRVATINLHDLKSTQIVVIDLFLGQREPLPVQRHDLAFENAAGVVFDLSYAPIAAKVRSAAK